MKSLTSVALAGALAISAVTATPMAASADGRHRGPQQYHHYSGGNNAGAALAAGAIFGLAFGALAAPLFAPPYPGPFVAPYPVYPYPYAYPYPPPPAPILYPRVTGPHVAWCSSQYGAWYNPASDTWTDYYGVTRRCIAPY